MSDSIQPPDSTFPKTAEFVPLSWTIDNDLNQLEPDVINLILKERDLSVEVTKDLSLRAKIIDACGLTCTFCHNEGTPVTIDNPASEIVIRGITGRSGRISVFSGNNGVDFISGKMDPSDPSFIEALIGIRENMGLNELHLTGGEPTLHPRLPGIIQKGREAGYSVSMTSNGENGANKIQECAEKGLDKINFSIFGTTAEELADVQNEKFSDANLAQKKIEALHNSVKAAADAGIKVAANLVMGTPEHEARVMRLIDGFDPRLDLRILPDLSRTNESARAIYSMLARLKAVPIISKIEAGSSNARVLYALPTGRTITFKQIRPTRLAECDECQFNNPDDCKEGFYGVRLYTDQEGTYKVGVCLQRMDLVKDVQDFIGSDLSQQVLSLRQHEYDQMRHMYGKDQ